MTQLNPDEVRELRKAVERDLMDKGYSFIERFNARNYTLEVWQGKTTIIVQHWKDGGWEVFKPTSDKNSIQESLAGIP